LESYAFADGREVFEGKGSEAALKGYGLRERV